MLLRQVMVSGKTKAANVSTFSTDPCRTGLPRSTTTYVLHFFSSGDDPKSRVVVM